MTWNLIPDAKVSANAIIDESLMKGHLKNNDDDHEARITALEGGSGGGGGGADPKEFFAVANVKDNVANYWKRRFHPMQSTLTNGANIEGFDVEAKNRNDRFIFQDYQDSYLYVSQAKDYLGYRLEILKDGKIGFKIKKGENFFSIGFLKSVGGSDNIEVYMDGALISGVEDENGNSASSNFSSVASTEFFQSTVHFHNLDSEEHLIEIKNNDSGTDRFRMCFIEVGYKSNNPTISNNVKIESGTALLKGSPVNYSATEVSFTDPEEGLANGYTGMVKIGSGGALTAVDGLSPAMTQCKAEESVGFSGSVTSLKVKSNWYFPDNGICLLSMPNGQHHLFSYNGKSQPSIANHTLDNIIWSSKPSEDYVPLDGFTGAAGAGRGDININLWAKAPILVNTSNNKIDFQITQNGTQTLHTATLNSGYYAADLIPLETEVKRALNAAKSINGEYFLKYDSRKGLWSIGCTDPEVTEAQFLFSSGANSGTSIHPTLGFATSDLTGATSYTSTTEVKHLAIRVFEQSKEFSHVESPSFKYSWAASTPVNDVFGDLVKRMGFPSVRTFSNINGAFIQFYPSDDSCGAFFHFLTNGDGSTISIQIDDGQVIYCCLTDKGADTNAPQRARVVSSFITWPKGSRKITIKNETEPPFQVDTTTVRMIFAGAREVYTKPQYETLLLTEQILNTYEVAPLSLYATPYGHNGGVLYSPVGTNDNINTITESGSWTGASSTDLFNQGNRRTSTSGSYVDINFTLTGSGGGISLRTLHGSGRSYKVSMFLSTGVINESTDRIQNVYTNWGTTIIYDVDSLQVMGLPAGTYTLRVKQEHTNIFVYDAIIIYDTVAPQENANTITDIVNSGQGVSYPINVFRHSCQRDSENKTPTYLERSGYKEGRVSQMNYSGNTPLFNNFSDGSNVVTNAVDHYSILMALGINGDEIGAMGFCKSFSPMAGMYFNYTQLNQPFIDGVQTVNNYSHRVQVKGGSAPSTTRHSISRIWQKVFNLSCSFSSGSTFTISDTRGLKDGMRVRLFDGATWEDFTIENIVTDTSFDIKQTPALITIGNVERVDFSGFHNMKTTWNESVIGWFSAFEFEPLPVFKSNFIKRISRERKLEQVTVNFKQISNGADLYYPTHSDGIQGNWNTSEVSVTGKSASNFFNFDEDLKDISINTGTIDVKITSSREVFEDIDGMEKY